MWVASDCLDALCQSEAALKLRKMHQTPRECQAILLYVDRRTEVPNGSNPPKIISLVVVIFFQCKSSADSHNIRFRSFHSLFIQNLSNYFGNLYDQLISQLFLYPNCWRIFEIWSHCAPQRQLKLLKRKRETLIVSTATAFAFLPSSTIFLASHNLFKAFLDLHFSALPLPKYLHK